MGNESILLIGILSTLVLYLFSENKKLNSPHKNRTGETTSEYPTNSHPGLQYGRMNFIIPFPEDN